MRHDIYTDEQLTTIITTRWPACSFCGNAAPEQVSVENSPPYLVRTMRCPGCNGMWAEHYEFDKACIERVPTHDTWKGRWRVYYEIVSGISNEVVAAGDTIVNGDNARDVCFAAPEQIADTDPYCDSRIDPQILIVEIEPAFETDSDDSEEPK